VVIATQWLLPEHQGIATVLAGVCAIVGHNWSVFIGLMTGRIRGGKGAATAFGTLVLIVPVYVVATMLLLGGFVIARTRYVSLAVLMMFTVAALSTVVLAGLQQMPVLYTLGSIMIVVIVFYRFRENIRRLQMGTERRLGEPG
jgi:glycerol-3-phosphate acyltransferase PlsY